MIIRHAIYQAVRHLVQSQLSIAFRSWLKQHNAVGKAGADARCKMMIIRRTFGIMMHSILVRCIRTWSAVVKESNLAFQRQASMMLRLVEGSTKALLRGSLAHLRIQVKRIQASLELKRNIRKFLTNACLRTVGKRFKSWSVHAMTLSRRQKLMPRITAKLMQRHVSKAFSKWIMEAIQLRLTARSMAERSRAALAKVSHCYLLKRKHSNMHATYNDYEAIRQMLQTQLAMAFRCWLRLHHAIGKANADVRCTRLIIGRTLRMMKNSLLVSSFRAWSHQIHLLRIAPVSYTHLTLPTIYSV